MKPKHHAMKTTPPASTVDSDPHDRQHCRMSLFIQAASPPDTGGCSMSRSIAATLPAAMLRPLPQAPVGGKKHASLDPPPKRGRKKRKGGGRDWTPSAIDFGKVHDIRRDLSLPRHSEITPFGCPFALLSASGEVMALSGHDISSPQQNERTPFGMLFRFAFGFRCVMLG